MKTSMRALVLLALFALALCAQGIAQTPAAAPVPASTAEFLATLSGGESNAPSDLPPSPIFLSTLCVTNADCPTGNSAATPVASTAAAGPARSRCAAAARCIRRSWPDSKRAGTRARPSLRTGYEPITIDASGDEEVRVIAEFLGWWKGENKSARLAGAAPAGPRPRDVPVQGLGPGRRRVARHLGFRRACLSGERLLDTSRYRGPRGPGPPADRVVWRFRHGW